MFRSMRLTDPSTGRTFYLEIDDITLCDITQKVKKSSVAMAALNEGYNMVQTALSEKKISCPEPPLGYRHIYQIINEFDERFANVFGHLIIEHLQHELIVKERNGHG